MPTATRLEKRSSSKAVFRALKRAAVRESYRALADRCEVPDYSELRPARRTKNVTLTTVATHLDVWPATISQLELGQRRDDHLAQTDRE